MRIGMEFENISKNYFGTIPKTYGGFHTCQNSFIMEWGYTDNRRNTNVFFPLLTPSPNFREFELNKKDSIWVFLY